MDLDVRNIETDLTLLLRTRLNITFLEGIAKIVVERRNNDGTDFSILPLDGAQARLVVRYENNNPWITLDVAENTVLEIPVDGGQYTNKLGIEELFGILEGVINEGMDEIVWKKGGEIVQSIGTINVKDEEKPVTIKCYSLHNPFNGRTRIEKHYFPYGTESAV